VVFTWRVRQSEGGRQFGRGGREEVGRLREGGREGGEVELGERKEEAREAREARRARGGEEGG
jgi:hypothetical protein